MTPNEAIFPPNATKIEVRQSKSTWHRSHVLVYMFALYQFPTFSGLCRLAMYFLPSGNLRSWSHLSLKSCSHVLISGKHPLEIVDGKSRVVVSLSQICCNSCSKQPGLAASSQSGGQQKAAVHSSVCFGIFKIRLK